MYMQYKLLLSPWKNEFATAISTVQKELFISSPFVNQAGVELLSKSIKTTSPIKLSLVTNITTRNILAGVTEPNALLKLYQRFSDVKISSLGRLHAKVYVIDDKIGIVTSANLTGGGLLGNFEYGILIDDPKLVGTIKDDITSYYALGSVFDRDFLENIDKEASGVRKLRQKTDKLIQHSQLATLLRTVTEKIDTSLLQNKIKEGKTVTAILADSILFVLKKNGALSTEEMHPFIQSLQPDICDDSIERVIDGQYFGKKWKHLVRGAQQLLKQRRLIFLQSGKWYLFK